MPYTTHLKYIILIILSSYEVLNVSGERVVPENISDSTFHPSHVYQHHSKVSVQSKSNGGVIKVLLPDEVRLLPICYPDTLTENVHASRLAHIYCRQKGFVTYSSRYKEEYERGRKAVLPTSAQCTGREETLPLCPWNRMNFRRCQEVLAVHCSSCQTKMVASNGTIHSPGFPHAYFYSLNCEWSIFVPDELAITLIFKKFLLPGEQKECESYVEVIYGFQRSYSIQRICPKERAYPIFVPHNNVRIRFHSGVYNQQNEILDYGVSILFQAISTETGVSQTLKVSLISAVVVIFFVSCIGCYFCHRTSRTLRRSPAVPNAPTREDLEAAVEFQRCVIRQQQNSEPIHTSDHSSTDVSVAVWRANDSSLPVTSALAPLGPGSRSVAITTTPRSNFPFSQKANLGESSLRIEKLRTKLVARFSKLSTSESSSNISVFFTPEAKARKRSSVEEVAHLLETDLDEEADHMEKSKAPMLPAHRRDSSKSVECL